jgi:hypothetical protein
VAVDPLPVLLVGQAFVVATVPKSEVLKAPPHVSAGAVESLGRQSVETLSSLGLVVFLWVAPMVQV